MWLLFFLYIFDGWNRSGDETQHLLTSTPDAVSF